MPDRAVASPRSATAHAVTEPTGPGAQARARGRPLVDAAHPGRGHAALTFAVSAAGKFAQSVKKTYLIVNVAIAAARSGAVAAARFPGTSRYAGAAGRTVAEDGVRLV